MMTTHSRRLSVRVLFAGLLLAGLLGLSPSAGAIPGPPGPVGPSGHPILFLGVTYFAKYDGFTGQDSAELDAIIQAFGGRTYITGLAYDVQLVVQSEIGWDTTEPYAPTDARHKFDFARYQDFAQLVRNKGLVWTPLLSYHYVPQWVYDKYGSCQYADAEHTIPVSCSLDAMPNNFMPFIPTSGVWSGEAVTWTKQAMQALSPYFGNPIKGVLCGNEMLTARRPNNPNDPDAMTAAGFDTRSRNWANAISGLVNAAKSIVQGSVPVSSKLFPYETHETRMPRTSVFPHVYDLLDSLDVIGIDAYPPSDLEYQALYRADKATFLSEFNLASGGGSGDQLLSWVQLGVRSYNLRYATWFCWKCVPTQAGKPDFSMTPDEQRGMRDAINWAVGLGSVYNPPARGVTLQLSTDLLGKSDSTWMVHPAEAGRHETLMRLGPQIAPGARYEVDYRPRPGDLRIVQVIDPISVNTLGQHALYLLEEPAAKVTAADGTFYVSNLGGNSDATVVNPASRVFNAQVFDWTPAWNDGVRRLESQSLSASMGSLRDWITAPDGAPVGRQLGNASLIAQETSFELWNHPERPLATVLSDMVNAVSGRVACGEASCPAAQGAYISHFTGAGCTGTESYYLPYDNSAYACRSWDGRGWCGTARRTVTNRSYRGTDGVCKDAWPGGNTLINFVSVYR
jgi:hypothetical protein